MNCGDTSHTQIVGLTPSERDKIAGLVRERFTTAKTSRPKTNFDAYALAMCGATRRGHKYIIVDGVYRFLGAMICDDDAGFGVVYDTEARQLGEITFGVGSCPPEPKRQ
jgi:hypothetical protein